MDVLDVARRLASNDTLLTRNYRVPAIAGSKR